MTIHTHSPVLVLRGPVKDQGMWERIILRSTLDLASKTFTTLPSNNPAAASLFGIPCASRAVT